MRFGRELVVGWILQNIIRNKKSRTCEVLQANREFEHHMAIAVIGIVKKIIDFLPQ